MDMASKLFTLHYITTCNMQIMPLLLPMSSLHLNVHDTWFFLFQAVSAYSLRTPRPCRTPALERLVGARGCVGWWLGRPSACWPVT